MELSFDRSQSVLESLREGVVVVDAGGEIVMANPAARRAMQRPYQDPVGKILWDVLAGDIARSAKEAWRALRDDTDGEAPVTAAAQIRRSSIESRDRFFDLTAVPVTSQQSGQDYGTLFLLVDATRNHELQQLKDRFLSSVSHELRTPLTNICAYSEILGSLVPGETAEWPEFVRVIHEESVQLSHLVDGMFDFLQLECGDAPFGVEPIDGVEAVRDILDSCRQKAEQNGIEFQVVERPCPQLIEVDRGRLEQVCRHLIDNAMKFTPRGGVVRVTCGDVDAGFELRIEDSGPGVPIDDRTNVFDKFTQLRDHMTDKPNGAGLGLATCRAIVGKLGGLIWCEDSSLGGAGFVVRLPLAGEPQLTGAGMMAGF
ncbi:MAG: PAS domain-containing sensor histidine kinase, partial [Planctomycetes bacterium]|nr:PAS domain-containing sensor histidine kinase [Planctomycetota bacterium]